MASAGIRTFGRGLKELRIHMCQKGSSSQGVREFVDNTYVTLKLKNPTLPILVRECSGISPKIWARYEYGREDVVDLSDMKKEEVLDVLNNLDPKV